MNWLSRNNPLGQPSNEGRFLLSAISWSRMSIAALVICSSVSIVGCSSGNSGSDAASDAASDASFAVPLLTGLHIAGEHGGLNPAFDPLISRYSVIASAEQDTSALILSPSAIAGASIEINGEAVVSDTTTTLDAVTPGDSVSIVASRDGQSSAYEILYLPSDFPPLSARRIGEGVSTESLYITTFTQGQPDSYLMNLDNNAVPTFYRRVEGALVFDYKVHEATQERSFNRFRQDRNELQRRNGEIVLMDENGLDSEIFETVGLSHTDIHDFIITPGNELVLLSYDGVSTDLSEFGLSANEVVEESVIQIIDRGTGQVNFEWRSLAEIPFGDQLYDPIRREYAHLNSIDLDADGNILASLRGTSNIVKIDRSSGRILWIFGGKANQFTFVNDPFTGTCGQHTATWLDNGNLLVFDNGQNCLPEDNRGELTRIVEYDIDEAGLTAELVWSFEQEDQYSLVQGSAYRLENGNTLISWGGRAEPVPDVLISEISPAGDVVFEISTDSETPVFVYRAFRF